MGITSKPVGIALVICDQVITEAGTNKKSLIGVFNNVASRQFPCKHSAISIFVSMTGGHGKLSTSLRCVQENTHSLLWGADGEVTFKDPNHVVEAVFEFKNVVFPAPGLHCIEILCGGKLVLQKRFTVLKIKE